MGRGTGCPFSVAMETWLRRFSSLLLKRRYTSRGASVSCAPWGGRDSSTRAWARARAGAKRRPAAASAASVRRIRVIRLAPVVEHQIVRMLVVVLLAPFHSDHGEVGMVASLEQRLVGRPVVGVDGGDHALELGRMRHVLDSGE